MTSVRQYLREPMSQLPRLTARHRHWHATRFGYANNRTSGTCGEKNGAIRSPRSAEADLDCCRQLLSPAVDVDSLHSRIRKKSDRPAVGRPAWMRGEVGSRKWPSLHLGKAPQPQHRSPLGGGDKRDALTVG